MRQILLPILFFLSSTCHAQSHCKYKSKYNNYPDNYGFFLIVHGSTLSAPNNVIPKSNGTKINSGFGFYYKKRLLRNEYLKIEFSFIQKGSNYNFNSIEILRLNYIEIPILWSHSYYRRKKEFHFEFGLAFSQLLFSSSSIALYAKQNPDPDARNFKNYDIPIIISLYAPLNPRGKDNIEIGLRYSYSPLSVHKTYKTGSMAMFKDDGIHNMTYGIQLVYELK